MISVIIVTGKVFHCFCLDSITSDSITEIVRLEQFDYYNEKSYTLTWRIWTSCPQLPQPRFRARDLHALLLQRGFGVISSSAVARCHVNDAENAGDRGKHWQRFPQLTSRRELTEPAPAGRRTKNKIGRASWEHRAVGRFGHFGTHRTGRPAARCSPDATIFRTHTVGGQPANFVI